MRIPIALICGCGMERDACGANTGGAEPGGIVLPYPHRAQLARKAFFLSLFTVVYNLLEGAVSVLVGTLAGSVALTGFGLDSFIESLSGGVMLWRFRKREDLSAEEEEKIERRAVKLVALSLLTLAVYIFFQSGQKIFAQEEPEPSLVGIVIAVLSIVVMTVLFVRKLQVARSLGSQSLEVDSRQTFACLLLSAALLVGLTLNYFAGMWWADPAAAIVIAALVANEGLKALRGEKACCQ